MFNSFPVTVLIYNLVTFKQDYLLFLVIVKPLYFVCTCPNGVSRSSAGGLLPCIECAFIGGLKMNWFISRHAGAKQWAAEQGLEVDHFISHLDIAQIGEGDKVIGTLPVQIAASVCEKGARYFHLSLAVPEIWRGKELSLEQMKACQAKIEEFSVRICS